MEAVKGSSDFCNAISETGMFGTDPSDPVFPNNILTKFLNDK